MKTRTRNSNKKLRKFGFRARMRTKAGRKIINRRRRLRGKYP